MAKRFIFDSPDRLMEVEAFCKEGTVLSVARVWRVARRQGKTAWDGGISVCFRTEGRERIANVCRIAPNGDEIIFGRLKYNPALEWCRKNLSQID